MGLSGFFLSGNRSWLHALFVLGLLLPSSTALAQGSCARYCHSEGRCTAQGGRCVAASDADCRNSQACEDAGRCTSANGVCVAASREDCRQSEFCAYEGRCHARDGECVVTEARDCRHAGVCVNDGQCTVSSDGRCVVATDADCRRSYSCRMAGACTARDGRCVATSSDDCRASSGCDTTGHCVLIPGRGCSVGATADCQASPACRRSGLCAAAKSMCVATAPSHCTKSTNCVERAECTLNAKQRRCEAASEADCRRTEACKRRDVCIFYEGRCYTEAGAKRARNSPALSVLKAVRTRPSKSSGASLADVITNIDAVSASTASSGLFRTSGLITAMPGASVKATKGGAGGILIARRGSGSVKSRGHGPEKVRGRVSRVSSMLRVVGELDRSEVMGVVNRSMGAISRCYERRLEANPALAGRLVFAWTIAASGRVKTAQIRSSTLSDPAVATCSIAVFRRMRFPAPAQGEAKVVLPFIYRPVSF